MRLAFLLALGFAASAASAANKAVMPKAFQGDWALEQSQCAIGPADSGNMRITARTLVNFESVAKIDGVKHFGPQTVRVSSRVTHNGGTFGSIEMMSLSTDKQRLTIGEHSDISVYKRCGK
jgi:hypothetical protein